MVSAVCEYYTTWTSTISSSWHTGIKWKVKGNIMILEDSKNGYDYCCSVLVCQSF